MTFAPAEEELGSQLSLLSEGSNVFQEQLDQLEFERDETKAKYEELKVGDPSLSLPAV